MSDTAPATGLAKASKKPEHETKSLAKAKATIKYMIDPKTGPQPAHLRTRTVLKGLRYFTIFLFWRLVRYAKYAAVGAAVAAISGTVLGSVMSGAAFFIAPPGILGGAGVGVLWAVGRFGWRRARARMHGGAHDEHADPRKDEQDDAGPSKHAERNIIRPPNADPW